MSEKIKTQRGDITILAEDHTSSSARMEALERIKNSDCNTSVFLEINSMLNGVVDAYYKGKISKRELTIAIKGITFAEYEDLAIQDVELFEKAKEKNIYVFLFDTRGMINAERENKEPMSYLRERLKKINEEKNIPYYDTQINFIKTEIDAINADEHRKGELFGAEQELARLERKKSEKSKLEKESLEIIERYKDSEVTKQISETVNKYVKNGGKDTDIPMSLLISSFSSKNNLLIVGEDHVGSFSDGDAELLGVKIGTNGILDDALKSLGHNVKVYSIRKDTREYMSFGFVGSSKPVVREKYDGYILFDKQGNRKIFANAGELEEEFKNNEREYFPLEYWKNLLNPYFTEPNLQLGRAVDDPALPKAIEHPLFSALLSNLKISEINIGHSPIQCNGTTPQTPFPIKLENSIAHKLNL